MAEKMLGAFVSNAITQLTRPTLFRWPLKERYSVRTYFVTGAILVLVPALIATGWLEYQAAITERRQLEQKLLAQAKNVTATLDREIQSRKNLLTIMARSSTLQEDNLEAFYREAIAISRDLNLRIVLHDATRRAQLVHTSFPWGNPRPADGIPSPGEYETELQSGKIAVSNLFVGTYSRLHTVAITAPIMRGSSVRYLLSISLPSEEISAILATIPLSSDQQRIGLVDRKGVILASIDPQAIGRSVRTNFAERSGRTQGVVFQKDLSFHYFFSRSELTGWYVDIGVPDSLLDAPRKRAIVSTAAIGSLLTLIAIIVAFGISDRITTALNALKAVATALRQQAPAPTMATAFRETKELADALSIASEDIREIEQQSRFAIEAADIGTWHRDLISGEHWHSEQLKRLLGIRQLKNYSREALLSRIHPYDRPIVEQINWPVDGHFMQNHFEVQYRVLSEDGNSYRWMNSRGRIYCDAGGIAQRVYGIVQDVTVQKEAERERDDLRRRLVRAQEEERLRLAHELHDQTGQIIAALMLELKAIESSVAERERVRVRQVRSHLQDMGKTLHEIAFELRPASIDELGLSASLGAYISEWSARSGIKCVFQYDGLPIDGLLDDIRTTVYRVIQEALTNVVKHALGATIVSINLYHSEEMLWLAIEDNGCGFEPERPQINSRKGLGLAGMRERLSLINGTLQIEAALGIGATIFVRIRLEKERALA
jgi:two-component system sensor histidine kinase UhpB